MLLIVAAGWWFVSARSLAAYSGEIGAPVAVGEGLVVGYAGLVGRDIEVLALRPAASPGLEVEFMVCENDDLGESAIGAVPETEAAQLCSDLRPVSRGTALPANPPEGDAHDYLVAAVRPLTPGPQWLCGFDMVYRSGWRLGWQEVSTRVFLNGPVDRQEEDRCG